MECVAKFKNINRIAAPVKNTFWHNLFFFGLGFLILHGSIRNLIVIVFSLIGINIFNVADSALKVLTILFLIPSILFAFRNRPFKIIISLSIFAFVWWFSFSYNIDARRYIIDGITQFFIECLPFLWLFYCLFDSKTNEEKRSLSFLFSISKVQLLFLLFVQTLIFLVPRVDIYNDYMSASYLLLEPLLIVGAFIFSSKIKVLDVFLFIIGTFYILIIGSRGAFLCELVFIFSYFLIFKIKKVINKILLLLASVVLVIFVPSVAKLLLVFGENRILQSLSSLSLFSDNSRVLIFNLIFDKIKENPFGLGVLSDRPILLNSNVIWTVYYSHNFILELGIDFGYFGFLISALIIFLLFMAYFSTNNKRKKILLLAFASFSIIKLLVSSSIWIETSFWKLLGIAFAFLSERQIKYGSK